MSSKTVQLDATTLAIIKKVVEDLTSNLATKAGGPVYNVPNPGSDGAPRFTGDNVTRYVKEWEQRCADWHWDEEKKVGRFPQFCDSSDIYLRDTLETGQGYKDRNWEEYKSFLLQEFEERDEKAYTTARLQHLCDAYISSPDTADIKRFLQEFKAISDDLLENDLITDFARLSLLIRSLPDGVKTAIMAKVPGLGEAIIQRNGLLYKKTEAWQFEKIFKIIVDKAVPKKLTERLNREGDLHTEKPIVLEQKPPTEVHVKFESKNFSGTNQKPSGQRKRNDVDNLAAQLEKLVLQVNTMASGGSQKKPTYDENHKDYERPKPVGKQASICYGCGNLGHFLYECPRLLKYKERGLINMNREETSNGKSITKITTNAGDEIVKQSNSQWLADRVEELERRKSLPAKEGANAQVRFTRLEDEVRFVQLEDEDEDTQDSEFEYETLATDGSASEESEISEYVSEDSDDDEDSNESEVTSKSEVKSETSDDAMTTEILDSLKYEKELQKRYEETKKRLQPNVRIVSS